ncbi:unnamed protein product, partial [marine sediment metagenome]
AVHMVVELPADSQTPGRYQMRAIVLTADLPAAQRTSVVAPPQEADGAADEGFNTVKQDPLAGLPPESTNETAEPDQTQAEAVARPGTEFPGREQWGSSEVVNTWMRWVRGCNPRLNDLYAKLIVESVLYYSYKFGIDHRLAFAMIKYESDFDPRCRSHAGAMGLTQLMPGTARSLGVSDPWDVQQNITGGLKYLAEQLYTYEERSNYEQTILGLACYNAGPNAVKRAGGVPNIRETQRYVRNVADLFLEFWENAMP